MLIKKYKAEPTKAQIAKAMRALATSEGYCLSEVCGFVEALVATGATGSLCFFTSPMGDGVCWIKEGERGKWAPIAFLDRKEIGVSSYEEDDGCCDWCRTWPCICYDEA